MAHARRAREASNAEYLAMLELQIAMHIEKNRKAIIASHGYTELGMSLVSKLWANVVMENPDFFSLTRFYGLERAVARVGVADSRYVLATISKLHSTVRGTLGHRMFQEIDFVAEFDRRVENPNEQFMYD